MAVITIKDEQGTELLTTDLQGEGLGRYFRAAASLRSVVPLARVFSKPLAERDGTRELGLAFEQSVPIGKNSELSIGAGAGISLGVHPSGSTIFAGSDLQAPVPVPNGSAYTSLTLGARLNAGVAGSRGALSFGFQAGTALRYAYFHPFDIVGGSATVGEAVKTMLGAAVFPADHEDLARLAAGAHASVAGEGEIAFRGQVAMSSTTNLLATPGLPIIGSVALTQGATVTVGAEWIASGEFELRASKSTATRVRLAFHRRHGRSLSVSAKGTVGVSLDVRGKDLLAALMTAISPNPEADLLTLVNAGLDDAAIEAIQKAVAASIDRSLTVAAQFEFSSLRADDALFAYDVDLARLDRAGKAAIDAALHGNLAPIGDVVAANGAGITVVASAAATLRRRRTSWRINVLGIFNVAGLTELLREGKVLYDPINGALTAADKVSARRILVSSRPLESDGGKLRKVLFESLLITAAYQASRALGSSVSLTAEHTYLEQRARSRRRDLEDHYRLLIALGLCDEQERDARLGADGEFGASTFAVENRLDAAACDALFLEADGRAYATERYEAIARTALLALLPANDPERAYRRVALASDSVWARVRSLGGDLDNNLPGDIRNHPVKLAVVRGDVLTIVWWAAAMHKAATELVAMRAFLGERNAETLAADRAFQQKRDRFASALADVVAETQARFDDPWDFIAMDAAASRRGVMNAAIITTGFAAAYAEAAIAPPSRAAVVTGRGARAAAASRSGTEARDWTAEELDVFGRHVINLRNGKLSGDGTFMSTDAQVRKIFTELIPEYATGLSDRGLRPRVMFFAHGGLVDEREGLRPVLARRRFWEMNGIYPVYFVWETGIRETLSDIVRQAGGSSRAGRGALTDAAIEALARTGGKQTWGQMKKSAENGAKASGGQRLVAELAAGLWRSLGGEIEFHAAGHSAGAILHSHFLPLLVSQPANGAPAVSVSSLQLLAPAITVESFKTRLQPLVGSGKSIASLTTYTMSDEFEQDDESLNPYGKSLLYLVRAAFEDERNTPILGLQRDLKQDLKMIRFFGLAGTEKVADIVFSKSDPASPLAARSESITHGGFDNDIATMTSLARRVLGAADSDPIVDYFEEVVAGFDRTAIGSAPAVPPSRGRRRARGRTTVGRPQDRQAAPPREPGAAPPEAVTKRQVGPRIDLKLQSGQVGVDMATLKVQGVRDRSQESALARGPLAGKVHVKDAALVQRSRAGAAEVSFEGLAPDDVVELELQDGLRVWMRVDDATRELAGRGRRGEAADVVEVPTELVVGPASRSFGGWAIKAMKVLGIDIEEKILDFVSDKVEGQLKPGPGLYRCSETSADGLQPLRSLDRDGATGRRSSFFMALPLRPRAASAACGVLKAAVSSLISSTPTAGACSPSSIGR